MSHPNEVREQAYQIYRKILIGKGKEIPYRTLADVVTSEYPRIIKHIPGAKPKKVSHATVRKWKKEDSWKERVEREKNNHDNEAAIPEEIAPAEIIPEIIPKQPNKKGKELTTTKSLTADDLTDELVLRDLREDRLVCMAQRRKLRNKVNLALDSINLNNEDIAVTLTMLKCLDAYNRSLQIIQTSMTSSDELLLVGELIANNRVDKKTPDYWVDKIVNMPKRKRDYFLQEYPALKQIPKIKQALKK